MSRGGTGDHHILSGLGLITVRPKAEGNSHSVRHRERGRSLIRGGAKGIGIKYRKTKKGKVPFTSLAKNVFTEKGKDHKKR